MPIRKKYSYKRLFGTGMAMGTADLVPGVSGGTIAFLLGIYNELLYSIKTVAGAVPRLLLKGRFQEAWSSVPLRFLLPLLGGIVLAIFGLANLISYLLANHEVYVWSVFFGLVAGSVLVVRKRVKRWSAARWFSLIVGAAGTYVLVGFAADQFAAGSLTVFLASAVAFSAMILPGISGSLMLVIMGQYEPILNAVSNRDFGLLIYVAAGGILGLALFSHLLSWLLKHYYGLAVSFLIGMMLGSLRKLWPWKEPAAGQELLGAYGQQHNVLPPWDLTSLIAAIFFVLALALILWLSKLGLAREHSEDINSKSFKDEYQESLQSR